MISQDPTGSAGAGYSAGLSAEEYARRLEEEIYSLRFQVSKLQLSASVSASAPMIVELQAEVAHWKALAASAVLENKGLKQQLEALKHQSSQPSSQQTAPHAARTFSEPGGTAFIAERNNGRPHPDGTAFIAERNNGRPHPDAAQLHAEIASLQTRLAETRKTFENPKPQFKPNQSWSTFVNNGTNQRPIIRDLGFSESELAPSSSPFGVMSVIRQLNPSKGFNSSWQSDDEDDPRPKNHFSRDQDHRGERERMRGRPDNKGVRHATSNTKWGSPVKTGKPRSQKQQKLVDMLHCGLPTVGLRSKGF